MKIINVFHILLCFVLLSCEQPNVDRDATKTYIENLNFLVDEEWRKILEDKSVENDSVKFLLTKYILYLNEMSIKVSYEADNYTTLKGHENLKLFLFNNDPNRPFNRIYSAFDLSQKISQLKEDLIYFGLDSCMVNIHFNNNEVMASDDVAMRWEVYHFYGSTGNLVQLKLYMLKYEAVKFFLTYKCLNG